MEIELSYNSSENNAITKILNGITSFTGTLRDESSVINPIIMMRGSSFSNYNYAYIPSFHRYYFIDEIVNYRTDMWVLKLSVDVLMSYKDDILGLKCIISSTESYKGDMYLNGEPWVTTVKTKTDIIPFPNGLLDSGEYILITAGGS